MGEDPAPVMKNQNYTQTKYYLAFVPGQTKVEKFADYGDAFNFTQKVQAETGRTVCIEAVY